MRILLIDNYDSFTYNLAHILRVQDIDFDVIRNDKIDFEEIDKYSGIIFSPGPGIPSEAGLMPKVISEFAGRLPMLGICLGHQAIAEFLGGELINREKVLHGVRTRVRRTSNDDVLLDGLDDYFEVGRYHSWEIKPDTNHNAFKITALDEEGSIMAIESEEKRMFGMQFHPESIMTEEGPKMMANFLNLCKRAA